MGAVTKKFLFAYFANNFKIPYIHTKKSFKNLFFIGNLSKKIGF